MWIFTTTGFVSAVADGKGLVVRSRDRLSLVPLATACDAKIKHTPTSDYPYRLTTSHENFAKWMSEVTHQISYRNFKSEVANVRGESFAKPLLKVWWAMHDVEEDSARSDGREGL